MLPIYRVLKFASMDSSRYINIDIEQFEKWKRLKIRSELLLFVGLVSPALVIYIEVSTSVVQKFWKSILKTDESAIIAWFITLAVPSLIFFGMAAVPGSKAKKIKPEGVK